MIDQPNIIITYSACPKAGFFPRSTTSLAITNLSLFHRAISKKNSTQKNHTLTQNNLAGYKTVKNAKAIPFRPSGMSDSLTLSLRTKRTARKGISSTLHIAFPLCSLIEKDWALLKQRQRTTTGYFA